MLNRFQWITYSAMLSLPIIFASHAVSKDDSTFSTRSVIQSLPQTCHTDCNTPYGLVLGIASGHVIAYSNCNAHCVVNAPYSSKEGIYTGIKWQCVEFARRWLLKNKGVIYGDVAIAADIWDKIHFVTRVSDGKRFNLHAYSNGSIYPPQIGDLLIYARAFMQTGHVAVVTDVDLGKNFLKVAEQNFTNEKWPADYARQIAFIKQDDKYWLLDAHLLGWKRVTE